MNKLKTSSLICILILLRNFSFGQTADTLIVKNSSDRHWWAGIIGLGQLMPFSVAPWPVLDAEHLQAVSRSIEIRQQYKDYILQLAKQTAKKANLLWTPWNTIFQTRLCKRC